ESPCAATLGDALLDEIARKLLLSRLLAGSGSRCRMLLQPYYLNGETTEAIAETMNSTPGTVLVFLHKCRKRALAAYRALTERGLRGRAHRRRPAPAVRFQPKCRPGQTEKSDLPAHPCLLLLPRDVRLLRRR